MPAHLERAGPFNPDGNNGYNVEHLRDFNNAAPKIAFGMETQPGHGASDEPRRIPGRCATTSTACTTDSVGGTTYGGTGVYGAQVGGVWDALLGEGRNFWFFASSDWHNRGSFGPDDRRTTQDFYPGEYQRNYTLVRNGSDKLRPADDRRRPAHRQQLRDERAADRPPRLRRLRSARRDGRRGAELAANAAINNTALDAGGCATMGEKLVVPAGSDIVVGDRGARPGGHELSRRTRSPTRRCRRSASTSRSTCRCSTTST